MLLQQLEIELVHGVGLVRPVVAHGPAAVGLVLIDDEAIPLPVDAEGPGGRLVYADEEAHFLQGHALGVAEGAKLLNGSGLPGPGPGFAAGHMMGVGRAAGGADLIPRPQGGPAVGAGFLVSQFHPS